MSHLVTILASSSHFVTAIKRLLSNDVTNLRGMSQFVIICHNTSHFVTQVITIFNFLSNFQIMLLLLLYVICHILSQYVIVIILKTNNRLLSSPVTTVCHNLSPVCHILLQFVIARHMSSHFVTSHYSRHKSLQSSQVITFRHKSSH